MMTRTSLQLFVAAALVGGSIAPAQAAVKLEGATYPRARRAIMSYGWTPVGGGGCGGGGTTAKICATYPEINNCSGTGAGFCNMLFVRGQRCLFVVTVGGSPLRDATVRNVWFDAGPCSKDS